MNSYIPEGALRTMKGVAFQKNLAIGDVFALDERPDVEVVELVQSEKETHVLYLFQRDDPFLEELILAIDEQRGIVGIYQEHHIVNEIHMNTVEIAILTLLL